MTDRMNKVWVLAVWFTVLKGIDNYEGVTFERSKRICTGKEESLASLTAGLLECSITCTMNPNCHGLCHSNVTNSCRLLGSIMIGPEHTQSWSVDGKYYEITHEVCQKLQYSYHRSLNICIEQYIMPKSWKEAQKTCERKNGSLISLQSERKCNSFKQLIEFNAKTMPFFVGLRNGTWLSGDHCNSDIMKACGIRYQLTNHDAQHKDTDNNCGMYGIIPLSISDGSCNVRNHSFICEVSLF